ncbi:MAG: TolB-like 6-bladed beta-propeller domain-containing protein [Bacteroidales bacterium]|jgi:hypothetical protein|nr:TolB-like 6-bladed beta-propeller domain-containing protein [Bacteroidales bacterium]
MNKRILSIFAVAAFSGAFLFFSCRNSSGNPDTFSEKDFAKTIDLKGSVLQIDTMIMRPISISVVDNLLFLTNSGTEYIFDVFDLNTNKKINECIRFGNGPDEMIRPTIVNLTKDSLWIFDKHSWLLRNYRMKDFISVSNPVNAEKIRLDHTHAKASVLSGNRIVASMSKSINKKFDYYGPDAKLLYSKGEYTDKSLSDMDNMLFYRFDYTTSLDDRIFVNYMFGDIIEIYDGSTGDLIKRRQGPNKSKPVLESITRDGATALAIARGLTHLCYSFAPERAGDEVFTLYYGGLQEEFDNRCNKMLVFDFKGNPLRIYNLDIPIVRFTVDAEKRIIYGLTDLQDLPDSNPQNEINIIKYEY